MHTYIHTYIHAYICLMRRDVALNVRLLDPVSVVLGTETHVCEVIEKRTNLYTLCMYDCLSARSRIRGVRYRNSRL